MASTAGWAAGAAAAYFVTARLGYALAVGGGTVTLWPPSGVTLALLLLAPLARWPVIALGAAAGSVASDLLSHYSVPLALLAACANVIESLVAATAVKAVSRGPLSLTLRGVAVLTIVAAVLSNAVTAALGSVVLLSFTSFHVPLIAWFVWWAGDGLGMLIVTPPILAWVAAWRARTGARWSHAGILEAAVITALLVGTATFVLGPRRALPIHPGPYLVFPFLFWSALRFGTLGAATESLALAVVATWSASKGAGPFVQADAAQWTTALHVYLYLAVTSLSALIFGAGVEARQEAEVRLRRNEERLRESQKLQAIGRLAGGIAHDFNNLLTVIQGNSDLVADAVPAGTPAHQDLMQIREAARRAAALTHQLLAFARRQALAPRELRVQEVIAALEPMLVRLIGVHVAIDVRPSSAGAVMVDRGQLEQVIVNLAVNARDAMPDGGTIRFAVSDTHVDQSGASALELKTGRYVRLDVSDTGVGMDPSTASQVFEPFFTTKPEGLGTGLGLSTVHGIVKQSNGGVEVSSAPGRGTTFSLFFPSAEAADR